jgi:hypothetical protein
LTISRKITVTNLVRLTDISFHKTEFMLVLKFSQSGSRLRRDLPLPYSTCDRPSALERREPAEYGSAAAEMRPEGGRGRQIIWKTLSSGLEALQPLEIP